MNHEPEEELKVAHILLSLRQILTYFSAVSIFLFLPAIYVSGRPNWTNVDENSTFTEFVRGNYKFAQNGSIFVMLENEKAPLFLSDSIMPLYVENMSYFTFGNNYGNFCNVPIRFGVLIMMPVMIFTAYLTSKMLFIENYSLVSAILGFSYFINEIFVYLFYFLLAEIHVFQDREYLPYSSICFSMALIFTVLKFGLKCLMEPTSISSIFRILSICVFIFSHKPLSIDIQDYADNIYCDNYTTPLVNILQLLCFFVIWLNNYLDIRKCRHFFAVVAPTLEEKIDNFGEAENRSIFVTYF